MDEMRWGDICVHTSVLWNYACVCAWSQRFVGVPMPTSVCF
jgi:hypothetical protein